MSTTLTSPSKPFTIFLLSWRLPSLTPEEFKSHYENIHMPLVQSVAGSLFPESHTRYYIQRNAVSDGGVVTYPASVLMGSQEDFSFDAFAELKFRDQEAFKAFFDKYREPDVAARLAEDEGLFLERSKVTVAVVEGGFVTKRL